MHREERRLLRVQQLRRGHAVPFVLDWQRPRCRLGGPDRSEPELVRDVPLPQLEDVMQLLTVCEQAHNVGLVRCHLHNVVTYGAA